MLLESTGGRHLAAAEPSKGREEGETVWHKLAPNPGGQIWALFVETLRRLE